MADSKEEKAVEGGEAVAREGAYSVVKVGSHSYTVAVGDTLDILWDGSEVKDGDELALEEVLLAKSESGEVTVGTPLVSGSSVKAKVVGKKLGEKLISYKKTRRHGYHKKKGHRQDLLQVEVTAL